MALKFTAVVREDARSKEVFTYLSNLAISYGFVYDEKEPDFVFSIGGDGTFLKGVHGALRHLKKCTFVGIHTGSLGFFADFKVEDIPELLQTIIANTQTVGHYPLVKASLSQNGKKKVLYALNEVRIENVHHTLVLDVELNGNKLETYRGNGILVATQVGSSGYNKSIGGAIIKRDLPLLEYTKIAPISNSVYRPLVNPLIIGPKDSLHFVGKNDYTFFGYDSLILKLSDGPFSVKVALSNKKVAIMHSPNRPYTKILFETFLGG